LQLGVAWDGNNLNLGNPIDLVAALVKVLENGIAMTNSCGILWFAY